MNQVIGFRKFAYTDPVLLMAVIGLLALGTVMVYSASSLTAAETYGEGTYFLRRQFFWILVGALFMVSLFAMNVRVIKAMALPSLVVMGCLLLLTEVASIGVEAKNVTRWIRFYGLTFQPSEFAKPALLLYVASYLAKRGDHIKDFLRGLFPLLLTVAVFLLMILRQPDFGTAVVLGVTIAIMLFVAGARLYHLTGLSLLSIVTAYFLVHSVGYRQRRLLAFLNPWQDPTGSGFQIIQSFIAFQSGGFKGQGLGDGTQKLLYLPEAHTDFIFSVIAEELGILGTMAVIVLFTCIVVQGFRLSLRIRDTFASQFTLGITALLGLQSLLNMAVAMALVPTKGLTLPLVSYGGSSMISTLGCIGVLLSFSSSVTASRKMAMRKMV